MAVVLRTCTKDYDWVEDEKFKRYARDLKIKMTAVLAARVF